MKKLFMFIAFLGLVNMAQAQCAKTASKSACCAKTMATATKVASLDGSIEKKVCEKSGSVSFVKKSVCEKSGNVSFSNVEYCTKSNKFVNVSPSSMNAKAVNASMDAKAKPACSKSKAACSKSKAACSKSKTASAKSATKEVKAIKVSTEQ
ncbi:MAG: hypothetical protein ACI9VN_001399 [Patescibacteria group bacterium]|jgi:hypothetical protein